MQLDNFNSAWEQFKLLNSMQPVRSNEILSIIDGAETANTITLQRVVFNLVMFIAITIFCQGG